MMDKVLQMVGFEYDGQSAEWIAEIAIGSENLIFKAYEENESWSGAPVIMVKEITDDYYDDSESMYLSTFILEYCNSEVK